MLTRVIRPLVFTIELSGRRGTLNCRSYSPPARNRALLEDDPPAEGMSTGGRRRRFVR